LSATIIPDRVTFIMNVDPFLQPSNGPNYFPFDPSIVYQIKIDNNQSALPPLSSSSDFKPTSSIRGLPVGFAGAGNGVDAPANSPAPSNLARRSCLQRSPLSPALGPRA
jgi:hypothetical protein